MKTILWLESLQREVIVIFYNFNITNIVILKGDSFRKAENHHTKPKIKIKGQWEESLNFFLRFFSIMCNVLHGPSLSGSWRKI